MFKIYTIFVVAFLLGGSEARKLSRCVLAKELHEKGIAKADLPNWVCLVESESSGNTAKVGGPNKNKSYDHGLFQINDKYWCSVGSKGKDCNVSCEDLKTDDITKSVQCALKVYKRHGFKAWYGWRNKCEGKPLPDLKSCFQ